MSPASFSSTSSSGSTSKLPSLFSHWKKEEDRGHVAPKPRVVDPTSINHPHMNPVHVLPPSPLQERDDRLSEFFGGRALGGRAPASSSPSYSMGSDIESLPSINKEAVGSQPEYPTTARYIFFYGFFFPPLWIVGIIILMMPLKAPAEWEGQKSTEEQVHLLVQMRFAERKWGKRCAFAFGLLVALIVIIAVAVWAALRHRN